MFSVTKAIEFCYGHRLIGDGPCRHLHGHNARLEIDVVGEQLDERGMVVDFSDLKRDVGRWINEHLDHRMILHQDDPAVPVLEEAGEPLHVMAEPPTAEAICKLIFEQTARCGYRVSEVRLWESPETFVTYNGA